MLTELPAGIGIALLTPDLFVTGAWPALAARLDALGLHLAAFTVVDATDATMAALYEGNTFKAGRARIGSTLGRKLPTLDMNIAVALAARPDVDVPALLDTAKGPSAYGARQPGDLREAGRVAHRCMSLIHTPDAELAGRDAAILFGEAAAGLNPAERLDPGVIDDVRGYLSPADEPHPYDIVCRTIVRAASVLSLDARLALPDEPAALVKAAKDLSAALRDVAPRNLADAVRTGLRPLAGLAASLHVPPVPTPASAAAFEVGVLRLELVRVLTVLTDCAVWSERSGETVVTALRRAALFVSPWERHMLLTALTFLPGPRG
jgi:hypothetical protein